MKALTRSKNVKSLLTLIVLVSSSINCATTNRTKTLIGMLAGAAVGGAVGYVTTPSGTDETMHSVYWGLAGAVATGVGGLFIFDEQKKSEELERQVSVLKKEVDLYQSGSQASSQGISENGIPTFPKEVPAPLQGLVEPGKWTHTRMPPNTWRWNGTHSVVRECEKFELIPPRIRLGISVGTDASEAQPLPEINGADGKLGKIEK